MTNSITTFKRIVCTLLMLYGILAGSAQTDTAFWFAVPKLCSHAHTPITLVVSALDEAAVVTVKKAYNNTAVGTPLTVQPNSSATLTLVSNDAGLSNMECPHNQTCNYGLYIHSTKKINAYIAMQQNNSEIYALKGNNGLGTQFFVTTQYQYDNGNGGGSGSYSTAKNTAEIIATENGTTVTITPKVACVGHAANVPFTVNLQRGQVYTLAANSQLGNSHLCGTIITSNKPIVVDVSDDSVTPHSTPNNTTDDGGGSADLVADQLVPEDMAGGQYIVVPSPSAVNNNAPANSGGGNYYLDYAFIFALEDNTDVLVVSGTAANPSYTSYTMNRGDKQKYHFTNNNPIFIYASHTDENTGEVLEAPIFVFQVTGAGKEFGGTQLPPINCTGSTSVGYRPLQSYHNHSKMLYLTILCDSNYISGFQVNNNANFFAASDWQTAPLGPFKYCRKNVSTNFAPSTTNMITFRVTNSLGKFHMGVFDINGQFTSSGSNNSYDDCSISYFSSYASESSIEFASSVTFNDYCEGDTIFFGFDSVDININQIWGPDNFELTQEPFLRTAVQPEYSGWYSVYAHDSRNCVQEELNDSIFITVHPTMRTTVRDTICPGMPTYDGTYSDLFSFPATSLQPTGVLVDSVTLQTVVFGCDSIVTLELLIRDSVTTGSVYDTICPGQTYAWLHNHHFDASQTADVGNLTDTVHLTPQTFGACDSLLTLNLTIRDIVHRETVYDTVCPGQPYTGFGGLFHFPFDSTTVPHILTDSVHLSPVGYACDSVLILKLTVRDSVFGEFSHIACNQYTWNGHTYVESGDYHQTLTDANGCDSIVTMHLEIMEPAVEIVTSGDDFCEYGEVVLNAISEYGQYIWNTGDTTQFLPVTQPGLYSVTVTQGDCQAYDNYQIDACDFNIILPNAITPSRSDGLNDCLFLPEYVHRFLSEFSIEIFNRWGALVYYNNDMGFQWCGEQGNRPEDFEKGRHVINGQVYIWIIRVKNLDGKPFVYKGTVSVL